GHEAGAPAIAGGREKGERGSAHLRPGAVGVAAGSAAHLLAPAVDPDGGDEVAAARAAPGVIALGDDLAGAARIRVVPAHRPAGGAAFPGVVLGLARQPAVAVVEVFADGAAHDAADDGAGEGGDHLAAALAELVADDGARDGADRGAGVLLRLAGAKPERRQQ